MLRSAFIGSMKNISIFKEHSDAVTRRQGSMSPSKIGIVRILELIDCGTSSDVVGQRVPSVNSSYSEEVLSYVKVVTGFDKVSSSCSVAGDHLLFRFTGSEPVVLIYAQVA